MKSLRKFEKERIMNMEELTYKYLCPNCKRTVYPRRRNYFPNEYSGLLWCPLCLRGKAGIFWREV